MTSRWPHTEAAALGLAVVLISSASAFLWRAGSAVYRHSSVRMAARRERRRAARAARELPPTCVETHPETPTAKARDHDAER
jgi:hypothetical protein